MPARAPADMKQEYRTAAVLGSGGHTAEMFRMIQRLEAGLRPTVFFLCPDDRLARKLISQYEKACEIDSINSIMLPRPRKVGQSYLTSLFTTLWTLLFCIGCLFKYRLDAIICNGPGICVCVVLAAHFTSWTLWRKRTRIIFIESFARTRRLSLSGKVLRFLADRFIVQWPALARGRGLLTAAHEYYGPMV